MKTLKNIFSVLFACIAVAGFWSCDDEVEYTPAEAPTTDQVFFPSSLGSNYDLTLDATSFTIEVQRVASESAATVALSVSDESGKLSIPTSVDFAAGAKTATLTIGYNPEDFEYDVYTKVNISIAESYATPYGNSAYTFTVGVPAPWTDWELMNTGTYTFTQYYSGTHEGRNCYVRTYKLNENIKQFRFEDLAGAYTYVVDHDASTGKCTIAPQHIFDNDSYGAVYIASSHTYWFDVRGDETATEEAVGASTFDPETGLFSLNVAYYVSAGTFGYGYEYFQLDGYTQPDYTLSLTEAGHYLAPDGTDNMVFHVQKGADVVSYKYISVEGKLNSNDASAKISGIIDGSIEAEEATESGYLAFAFPTAGEYSVVVVGFDEAGEAVAYDYLSVEYLPVGQEDPWQTLGMCTYTDDVVMPMYTETGETCTYKVEIQERTDKPGMFRLVNPYGEAFPFYQYAESYPEKDVYVEIDAQNPEAVTIAYQSLGLNLGDGELGIYSAASYYLDGGESADGLYGTYADNVISFPVNGIFMALGGKLYYGNTHGEFKVDMNNMEAAGVNARSASWPSKMVYNAKESVADAPASYIRTVKVDVEALSRQRQSTVK